MKKIIKTPSLTLLSQFSNFLSKSIGIYFPYEGLKELESKLQPLMKAFGFDNLSECMEALMRTPLTQTQIETIAHHLTIGETYFFRDSHAFKTLEERILPKLIREREKGSRHIRIWSAACCTGEEPYSVAILLDKLIPHIESWDISILGTDLNSKFLQKAEIAQYKEWSFRATPPEVKEKYFTPISNGRFQLIPKIRKMVRFNYLNLVEESYPSVLNGTNSVDLIFCNNVLIYFSNEIIQKVIKNLVSSLNVAGVLMVTPIEVPYVKDSRIHLNAHRKGNSYFTKIDNYYMEPKDLEYSSIPELPELPTPLPVEGEISVELPAFLNLEDSTLKFDFTKQEAPKSKISEQLLPPSKKESTPSTTISIAPALNLENYSQLYKDGRYLEIVHDLETFLYPFKDNSLKINELEKEVILLTRAYANLGKITQAKFWCEKALNSNKINPLLYYLHASILEELQLPQEAIQSLKKALFLHPQFAIGYFSLGNLLLRTGQEKEAKKQFRNALNLLNTLPVEETLEGGEGLTAHGLKEIIEGLVNVRAEIKGIS